MKSLILFILYYTGNHTAHPLYGTVLNTHERNKCTFPCSYTQLQRVACVTNTSDDALYRTRGGMSGCVSHAAAAKLAAQYCYCLRSTFRTVVTKQPTRCQTFPRVGNHFRHQLQHAASFVLVYLLLHVTFIC